MIILEGPDGGGKTTLAERITKRFGLKLGPRASSSIDGPVNDLCAWVDDDLLSWGTTPLQVYDRYPLISEPIYGPICRGSIPDRMSSPWMRRRLNTFRNLSLVIWCIPPANVTIRNIDDSADNQMDGVVSYAPAIWASYSAAAHSWTGTGMTYDYSTNNPEPQLTQLTDLLFRHFNKWRNFS